MTSDLYVWVWLPGETVPVPAGRLSERFPGQLFFDYGRRYLERSDAISLAPTLPLGNDTHPPTGSMGLPGALRDASPDAWGRRVVQFALTGARGKDADTGDIDEHTYLLHSGSNRFGAVDFQSSAIEYVPRDAEPAPLGDLLAAADVVERGGALTTELERALLSGTAMGGARPKAMVRDGEIEYLAKFSSTTDVMPVVSAEAASMYLARLTGVTVPDVRVEQVLGRSILLVERFDRTRSGARVLAMSALTLTGLDELTARYGTYPDILDALRVGGALGDVGHELFLRIAFNMAISNSDDHLRNHAALWDGRRLALSPAYDLSPTNRSGETATLALSYDAAGGKRNNLAALVSAAHLYGLTTAQAYEGVDRVVGTIRDHWKDAADFARLSVADRALLWGRQFLNDGTLYDLPVHISGFDQGA